MPCSHAWFRSKTIHLQLPGAVWRALSEGESESAALLSSKSLYFLALGCAGVHVISSWPWGTAVQRYPLALLAVPYACVCLLATWRLILLFVLEHYEKVCM